MVERAFLPRQNRDSGADSWRHKLRGPGSGLRPVRFLRGGRLIYHNI